MDVKEDLIDICDLIGPSTHFMPKTKGETVYDAKEMIIGIWNKTRKLRKRWSVVQ